MKINGSVLDQGDGGGRGQGRGVLDEGVISECCNYSVDKFIKNEGLDIVRNQATNGCKSTLQMYA